MKLSVQRAMLASLMLSLLGGLGTASAQSRRGQAEALIHCDAPMGTLALIERMDDDTQGIPPAFAFILQMQRQQGLLPTPQLLGLLVQRSNCFTVVERSTEGMAAMERERALTQSGAAMAGSQMGSGQMVVSDYSLKGDVLFSGSTGGFGGGGGGGIGGMLGSMRKNEAWVTLTMVDNRSGVRLAMAEGQATKRSWNGLAAMFGGGGLGGLSAYSKTPEGKIILPAFVNAYNEMIRIFRTHQAQQPVQSVQVQRAAHFQATSNEQESGQQEDLTEQVAVVVAEPTSASAAPMSLYEAQHRLTHHGYTPGAINGEMGEETAKAIRDFQMNQNLPITGQIDAATAHALRTLTKEN